MRRSKTVKIDDKEITVKELRIKDIRSLLDAAEQADHAKEDDLLKQAETLLPLVADLKLSDIDEMAPSEIKVLWEAFWEVNADFLSVIERLGIKETFKNLIRRHLTDSLSDLSSGDIPKPGNMDGASS